jgi:hypothetical protein
MTKTRLALPALAAGAALLFAGCGGGDDGSSPDPATVAPPDTALFVEGTVRPSGSLKTDVEALAQNIAGVDDLGGTIVSKLEKAARADGESLDYSEEVEPWLGEKAGFAFGEYDGSDFSDVTFAVQSTDTGATREFVEKLAKGASEPVKDGSYEGVGFKVEEDGTSLGVIGEFLVFSQGEDGFKEAVDASEGESLGDVDAYRSAVSHAPGGSLANAYVDVGGLIEEAGNEVDAQTEQVFKTAGIELREATALLSLVPGSDQVELDVIGDLGETPKVSSPAKALLESLPADSIAALSASDYGSQLKEGIDKLDAAGIPGQVPPHKLKQALERLGVNLDEILGSLEDAAVFAVGDSRGTLGGALVFTTKQAAEARSTVANVGLLLRSSHTPGVAAVGGKAAGFSIHSPKLGGKPVVVAAEGTRIAVGYGLPATLEGLTPPSSTLAENAAFEAAAEALGDTPMTGFLDGKAALRLVQTLVSPLDSGFQEALPYLDKIEYVGFGGGVEDGLRSDRLIIGLEK